MNTSTRVLCASTSFTNHLSSLHDLMGGLDRIDVVECLAVCVLLTMSYSKRLQTTHLSPLMPQIKQNSSNGLSTVCISPVSATDPRGLFSPHHDLSLVISNLFSLSVDSV